MARMEFPASVLAALNPRRHLGRGAGRRAGGRHRLPHRQGHAGRTAHARAGGADGSALNPLLGYNLDAWDGYLAARETLLGTALQLGKKLVCLAGDTHNAWHSDLTLMGLANPALAGVKVGEEFATASVSSPGLEDYLAIPPAQVKAHLRGRSSRT